MNQKSFNRDLTEGNIAVQLICFIGPLFLSNILQTAYNVVDMAVVGRCTGNTGLSAVSICGDLVHILTFIAFGFANAGQVLISHHTGARNWDSVKTLIGNLFTLLFIISAAFSVLSLVFWHPILLFANTPAAAMTDAGIYFRVSAAGLVFTYGYNAVSAVLRGMGDSRRPFIFVAIASLMNIALDLILVTGLGLGVFGAAFATVFSQAFSFVVSVIYLYKNRDRFEFEFARSCFSFNGPAVSSLVRLGIPMALQSGLIQGSKLIVNRWINAYGVNISAITGVGSKFNNIGLTFSSAVGSSASAMIGQCIGARKYERVGKTICVSALLAMVTSGLISLLVIGFPRPIFSIFTTEEHILSIAAFYAPVVVIMLFSSAFRAPMNGLINGSGNPRLNLVLAFMDGIVGHIGLAAMLGFGFGLGLTGLWYGNALAGFIPFFVGLIYYFSGKWKTRVKSLSHTENGPAKL